MRRDCRTPTQNRWLVLKTLDWLAEGKLMKEVAWEYGIKWNTLENLVKRYRWRWGFRTLTQMVAAHMVVKTETRMRKHK